MVCLPKRHVFPLQHRKGSYWVLSRFNDITQVNLCAESNLVLYAYDILLYRPISSTEDHPALQADIDELSSRTRLIAMTFGIPSASP